MTTWWSKPTKKAPVWWEYKAEDGPPRGDFEQRIVDALAPVFDEAREKTLIALTQGDQFDEAGLHDALLALFLPTLTEAVLFAVNDFADQFALGFEPGEVEQAAREWARRKAEELVTQLITTTQGWLSGLEPEEVEGAIDRAFGAFRRETIGASETTDALSAGALLFKRLAEGLGLRIELFWYTRRDERVCDICRPLHNQPQEVWAQQFPSGPKAHVKCRCGLRARLVRETKAAEKKKGPGRGWWGPTHGGTHGGTRGTGDARRGDVTMRGMDSRWGKERDLDDDTLDEHLADVNLSTARLKKMFDIDSSKDVEITAEVIKDGILATVRWKDDTGLFAQAKATYWRTDDGLICSNNSFVVSKSAEMGSGFGKKLLVSRAEGLREAGYAAMKCHADISIGRYAWAKLGYDYADPQQLKRASSRFKEWVGERIKEPGGQGALTDWMNGNPDWPTFTSARAVATYDPGPRVNVNSTPDVDSKQRMPLGKAFLLESNGHGDWDAIYYFNE